MNWHRILIGFAVSVIGGDLVIYPIMEWYFWPRLRKDHGESKPKGGTLTRQVGCLERALYTGAILIGAWQWIGIWLAIKVASRWRSTSGDSEAPVDNVWLIGTGLSVLLGFVGAWIAAAHLPMFPKT
jgi:hypothetical protein